MKHILTIILLSLTTFSFSQRGIGASESGSILSLDSSAIIDLEATTKGALLPRVSLTATNVMAPIIGAANSLLVYNYNTAGAGNTAVAPGYYYWDTASIQWIRFFGIGQDSSEWVDAIYSAEGVIYAKQAKKFGNDVVISDSGRLGVGTTNPLAVLDVYSNDFTSPVADGLRVHRALVSDYTFITPIFGGATQSYSSIGMATNKNPNLRNDYIWFYSSLTDQNLQIVQKLYLREKNTSGPYGVNSQSMLYVQGDTINPSAIFMQGNVGIGTENPTSLLELGGGCCRGTNIEINDYSYYGAGFSGGTTIIGHNVRADTSNTVSDQMEVANNHATAGYAAVRVGGTPSDPDITGPGSISFYGDTGVVVSGAAVTTPNMIIKGQNGRVGIGTTTPETPLDVNGSINSKKGIYLSGDNIGAVPAGNLWGLFQDADRDFRIWRDGYNPVFLLDRGGAPDSKGLGHFMDGRLRIGPANYFITGTPVDAAAILHVRNDGGTPYGAIFDGGSVGVGIAAPTGRFHVSSDKDATIDSTFIVTENGRVGIGTTNPERDLHVKGDLGVIIERPGFPGIVFKANVQEWSIGSPLSGGNFQIFNKTLAATAITIDSSTNFVGINVPNPSRRLAVGGDIQADSLFLTLNNYADYVFEDYFYGESKLNGEYKFQSLNEIETYIKENKHLPGVKSIKEVTKENGEIEVEIGSMSNKNLEKIEELYLHLIEVNKEKENLKVEIEKLKQTNKNFAKELEEIKKLLKKE